MITIAIDGPSASGKTSTAKRLAKKFNLLHLNTGALYRAIAVYLFENNINSYDEKEVEKALPNIEISVDFVNGEQLTKVNGVDVSSKLYTTEMGKLSSVTSAYGAVRQKMLHIQRDIATKHPVVMEGRDITSVVLPNAKYKFFLSASNEIRAKRRLANLLEIGENITQEQVLKDLKERDERDSSREHNPLVQVEDAILINTDHYTLDEVVAIISSYIKE